MRAVFHQSGGIIVVPDTDFEAGMLRNMVGVDGSTPLNLTLIMGETEGAVAGLGIFPSVPGSMAQGMEVNLEEKAKVQGPPVFVPQNLPTPPIANDKDSLTYEEVQEQMRLAELGVAPKDNKPNVASWEDALNNTTNFLKQMDTLSK